MKANKNFYSITLTSKVLVLFFVLFSSAVLSAAAESAPPAFTEARISYSGFAGIPALYGDKVVWDDWRNKELSSSYNGNTDIYLYNLSANKESRITTSNSAVFPAVYSDKIVWSDNRSGELNIYMYNLSTSKETQISSGANQIWPHIYGNSIVWQGNQNGGSDVYLYNLSTRKETRITSSSSAVFPAIYEDRIVWSDNRAGKWDIYMYNTSTSKEKKISSSGTAVFSAICGDRIVWSDYRNGDMDLYLYNLSSSRETRITAGQSVSSPAIHGDLVVWANTLNGKSNIYIYNLTTQQEIHTTGSSYQYYPSVNGNRVVWTDGRNGIFDIYMANLSKFPTALPAALPATLPAVLPVAEFSASPISGNAPLNVAFTDRSKNSPASWNWSFGDGSLNSTEKNPVHVYNNAGKYTVTLVVKNKAGSNTISKTGYINVTNTAGVLPVAAFTASPVSGKVPLTVRFTDKSINNPISWSWDFGDKTTSKVRNPVHTYSKAGKYNVSLIVKNATGSSKKIKSSYISVNVPRAPGAAFSASPASGKAPLKVQFTDKSTGYPTSWKWSFGDKTYSTLKNPVHKYTKTGKYTVTLVVRNSLGSCKNTGYVTVK